MCFVRMSTAGFFICLLCDLLDQLNRQWEDLHGNRVKINIFKCNKFNILSYIFCFSSFFNGSAFSLYCVVITSLSLGREMRPPDSTTPFLVPFFHFTKTYSKHLLHSSEANVLSAWDTAATNTRKPLPAGVYSLPPKEFISLSNTRGNSNQNFIAGKHLRDLFIPALFKKNNSHLLLNVIYVPGIVLSALHALSTYSSPQPYKVGTTTPILVLQMKKLVLKEVRWSDRSPKLSLAEQSDLILGSLTPQPVVLTNV